MKKGTIVTGYTLKKYNKKYGTHNYKLLKYTKSEVEEFNKKYAKDSNEDPIVLRGRRWALIGDTYYELPKSILNIFSKQHIELKLSACFVVVMGITVATILLCREKPIEYITYTLDSDIKLEKNPNYDVEIVDAPTLPGKTLKHKSNDKDGFKVLAFTDTHLDHNRATCSYTFSMVARNIMEVKPDLVVFCGDNITSSYNEPRSHQFAKMLEELGVYWCATLGNHEKNRTNPYCIERDKMINIFCEYPHCLIDNTIKKTNGGTTVWGVGNTLINLVNNGEVTQSLYFLDSGTEMNADDMKEYAKEIQTYKDMGKAKQTEVDFYDYIKQSQVDWYKETFTKVREQSSDTHSTIFSHVPLIEQSAGYLYMFNEWETSQGMTLQGWGSNSKIRAFTDFPQDNSKCQDVDTLLDDTSYPYGFVKGKNNRRREDLCYGPHDIRYIDHNAPLNPTPSIHTPIFAQMKEFGTNNAFFCGHDHQNNYSLKWDGEFLGYLQPACYSSNNLYTTGLLGDDPYNEANGHLIQGFTELTYSSETDSGVKNVISNIENKDNYTVWKNKKPELYTRALNLVKTQLLSGKHKVYTNNRKNYLDGK